MATIKSIEEKAKRYDEAIEKINSKWHYKNKPCFINVVEIFPELKESEDKRMIQYFKDLAPFDKADELYEKYGFSHKDAIAWLEKQGEQKIEYKPAWSEEAERMLEDVVSSINEESIREGLQGRGINYSFDTLARLREDLINWVKAFKDRVRPQSTWKPSDQQMASITDAVRQMKESPCYDSELVSLYNDLKKLKG